MNFKNILPNKVLAVDFDGTIVEDKFPEIGEPHKDFIEWLKNYRSSGGKLILWTCRTNEINGEYVHRLQDAVLFCADLGLHFDAVNCNLLEVQNKWGQDCRKVLADYYIDDKSVVYE